MKDIATQMSDLEAIFYDALIIEIDFTDWFNKIVLAVIACSASMMEGGCQRVFLVEFIKPSEFSCNFSHYETMRKYGTKSFAWRIDKFEIVEKAGSIHTSFQYSPGFPKLQITCAEIGIREIEPRQLYAHFPGWNKPDSGLCSLTIAKKLSEGEKR